VLFTYLERIYTSRSLRLRNNPKDLGVTFDNKLKFDEHINIKNKKAYQTLGIVKEILFI